MWPRSVEHVLGRGNALAGASGSTNTKTPAESRLSAGAFVLKGNNASILSLLRRGIGLVRRLCRRCQDEGRSLHRRRDGLDPHARAGLAHTSVSRSPRSPDRCSRAAGGSRWPAGSSAGRCAGAAAGRTGRPAGGSPGPCSGGRPPGGSPWPAAWPPGWSWPGSAAGRLRAEAHSRPAGSGCK